MTPTIAGTEDCQATVAASCRWVKPKVLSSANSRRRRRTEAIQGEPQRADRPGGEDGGERRGGRADGVVVGDLGRAKDGDHAPDRAVGVR